MSRTLLGIDVGTTSLKAVLYGEDWEELTSVTLDYSLNSWDNRVELDPEVYVRMTEDAIATICQTAVPDAMAIDTQCETLIVTDEAGKPLRDAIVWLDNRAVAEAEEIERVFGRKTVYTVTGQPEIAAAWPACKLLWIRRHEPQVWENTKRIFLLADWLQYRLTGQFVTEGTLQSSSLYYDIRRGAWWDDMLSYLEVSTECLPRLGKSTDPIGTYRGIPVMLGAMDQVAGAIGMGVTGPGMVSEMTGTTLAVFAPCAEMPPYREGSIVPCHVNYDGSYCRLLWTSAAGLALKWFRNAFCEANSFRELDALAETVSAGSDGVVFVPHLCGSTMPQYQPEATAAFCGVRLEHGRAHFTRAVMESVVFMLKECLDELDGTVTSIRSSGGGAKSSLWCQMKADATGSTIVTLSRGETATLGSAIMAGVGLGLYASVEEAASRIRENGVYSPSSVDYSEAYRRYRMYCRRVNPRYEQDETCI